MAGPTTFAGDMLLMVAILFGLVSTVITYMNGRKFKGEVFEAPFVYFSLGLFMITFSLINVTFFGSFLSEMMVGLIHDLSFIIGLSLTLFASIKITQYLRGFDSLDAQVNKITSK